MFQLVVDILLFSLIVGGLFWFVFWPKRKKGEENANIK